MFEHHVIRELPVAPDAAYSWLTDYRPDDLEIFDDPDGKRIVELLGPGRIRLQTIGVIAGVKGHADGTITFSPPDQWSFDGHIAAMGRRMVHIDSRWTVSPGANGGTRFEAKFGITPVNFIAKLYLRLRGAKVRRLIEWDYDQIAKAIAKELAGPTGTSG